VAAGRRFLAWQGKSPPSVAVPDRQPLGAAVFKKLDNRVIRIISARKATKKE